MRTTRLLTPFIAAAALALAASPALGQHRQGSRQASPRSGPAAPAPRTAEPRGSARNDPRGHVAPPQSPTRPYTVLREASRPPGPGRYAVHGGVRLAPRVLGPRAFIIGGPRLYRPYYTFRPRVSLSFGLWVGYPVAYPYYEVPYVYSPSPYAYSGYRDVSPYNGPASGEYAPADGDQPGGLSFTVSPPNAAVFVDGTYVGTADEFGPTSQPLGLMAGRHRIEIRANGFRTLSFDADVIAGQVVPYRATLQR
jgi:hypothetical protein